MCAVHAERRYIKRYSDSFAGSVCCLRIGMLLARSPLRVSGVKINQRSGNERFLEGRGYPTDLPLPVVFVHLGDAAESLAHLIDTGLRLGLWLGLGLGLGLLSCAPPGCACASRARRPARLRRSR
jgi:hypothetical protein